jgi:hypothetical protein
VKKDPRHTVPSFTRKDTLDPTFDTENDFYPTNHSLTRHALNNIFFNKNDSFLECAAGSGDITKILREYGYNDILQCDINPRKEDIVKQNFITEYPESCKVDHVFSNPPFDDFLNFMIKASSVAEKTITFFLPVDYLHGKERFEKIYQHGVNGFKLKYLLQPIMRPLLEPGYDPAGPYKTGMRTFSWFSFEKDWLDNWTGKFIDNRKDVGKPWLKEQMRFDV